VIKFSSVTEPDPEDPIDIPESKCTKTPYKPPKQLQAQQLASRNFASMLG
jgi:hypothetical protein